MPERREFQRLTLDPPIPGTFGVVPVSILDVGVVGARMQHAMPLDVSEGDLRFSWGTYDVAMRCAVVRSFAEDEARFPGSGCDSGVRFSSALDGTASALRMMLATLVSAELETRHNALLLPETSTVLYPAEHARRPGDAFLVYHFQDGHWRAVHSPEPQQPAAGFTVACDEDGEELHQLCNIYQATDDEGRRLIRLFAELSIGSALGLPRQSFEP